MAKKPARKDANGATHGDGTGDPALDFRHHHAKRPNNPTGGNSAEGKVDPTPRIRYHHDPHRPPTLLFDPTGKADELTEPLAKLMAEAQQRPLTAEEVATLTEALHAKPWLEWAGKREQPSFVVDAPAIHLHERVSSRALMRVAARKDVQRSLFGESDLSYSQSVQFYHHSVNWANRLILGDNRAVMASLAHREKLAGKVQMIYIDPPYGIKYASNFQSEIDKRDVKEVDTDLTREMETIQAFRDTWKLGVHSYLNYINQLLTTSRELLAETGFVFVQTGEANVHHVRELLDGVLGP